MITKNNVIMFWAALLLTGCLLIWPSASAASPPPAKAGAKVTAPAAAAKPETQPAAYRYSPAGKADPFKSFVEEEVAREAARKKRSEQTSAVAVNILQRHEAGQYILVGVAGDEKGRTAMVVDPTKKYFFSLNVGTIIGLNMGRVTEIRDDQVIIDEQVRGDKGRIEKRKVVIRFQ